MPRVSLLWIGWCVSLAGACGPNEPIAPSNDKPESTPLAEISSLSGSITWDAQSQMKQIASTKGCDSWTPTWASDGNLYSGYGDCQMQGVPKKLGMGFARIAGSSGYGVSVTSVPTGDPANWNDAATGAGIDATGDGMASEKPAGMLQIGSRLWVSIRNIKADGTGVRLKYSDNYTTTSPDFTWVSWSWPNVGYASFVQYGQGYAGGPANYVYAVIPMRSDTTGSVSNSAYNLVPAFGLIRGARSDLKLQSNWQFFCGTSSAPAWCSSASSAKNIFSQSGTKFRPRAGMSWNPGLGRFMLALVYDPTPSTTSDDTRFDGGLKVFTSPNPWGPWQNVFSSGGPWPGGQNSPACDPKSWGSGERADIPTKYMSADGKTFYLFSSGGDCLSIARGVLSDAPAPVADPVSTPTVAVRRATAAGDTAWVVATWTNPATMAPNDSISTSYYRSGAYQFTSSHHTHGTSDSARVAVTVPVGSSQTFKVCAANKYWLNGSVVLSSADKCSTTVTWVRTTS